MIYHGTIPKKSPRKTIFELREVVFFHLQLPFRFCLFPCIAKKVGKQGRAEIYWLRILKKSLVNWHSNRISPCSIGNTSTHSLWMFQPCLLCTRGVFLANFQNRDLGVWYLDTWILGPRDPGSPSENGFMEPKYYAFRRWLDIPIIIWEYGWMPRVEESSFNTFFGQLKMHGWETILSFLGHKNNSIFKRRVFFQKFPGRVSKNDGIRSPKKR